MDRQATIARKDNFNGSIITSLLVPTFLFGIEHFLYMCSVCFTLGRTRNGDVVSHLNLLCKRFIAKRPQPSDTMQAGPWKSIVLQWITWAKEAQCARLLFKDKLWKWEHQYCSSITVNYFYLEQYNCQMSVSLCTTALWLVALCNILDAFWISCSCWYFV